MWRQSTFGYCSQGVPQVFTAPVYRAHCAVIFAIAQLSCNPIFLYWRGHHSHHLPSTSTQVYKTHYSYLRALTRYTQTYQSPVSSMVGHQRLKRCAGRGQLYVPGVNNCRLTEKCSISRAEPFAWNALPGHLKDNTHSLCLLLTPAQTCLGLFIVIDVKMLICFFYKCLKNIINVFIVVCFLSLKRAIHNMLMLQFYWQIAFNINFFNMSCPQGG